MFFKSVNVLDMVDQKWLLVVKRCLETHNENISQKHSLFGIR